MKYFHCGYISLIVFFLGSCAIQVPPDGGPKDVVPPKLVSSEPPNYSTSFNRHDIRLDFDEIVALNEISSQLIVSPLLKYPPETKIRKHSLLVHLQDTLLENTTYTMNFGEGISDNNENNKLENFQFVFSTGPVLDSLDISGKIEKAFDKKTEKGILALLYHETYDSLPYLERPVYFSRTNDSGSFRINNISPGYYKMIGLKETDGNYLYSPGDESIAFPDSLVKADSEKINIRLFSEVPQLRFLRAYSEFPGKAVLVFNTAADTVRLKWLSDSTKLNLFALDYSREHDTINIWYKNIITDSMSLVMENFPDKDTVTLRLFKYSEDNPGRKTFLMTISPGDAQTTIQHLHLPYLLKCNHPLIKSDFNSIIFLEDSLPVIPEFNYSDSLHRQIKLFYNWKSKSNYSLFIPPGTFTDIYGLKNDTIELTFSAHGENDYGSVMMHFQNAENIPYIIQLTDGTGYVYREFNAKQDSTIELDHLDPKIYKLKLIRDKNGNGKWDTGNYLRHIQPEEIEYYPENITVRANWDVDVYVKALLSSKN